MIIGDITAANFTQNKITQCYISLLYSLFSILDVLQISAKALSCKRVRFLNK
jgi:hypothetical protein